MLSTSSTPAAAVLICWALAGSFAVVVDVAVAAAAVVAAAGGGTAAAAVAAWTSSSPQARRAICARTPQNLYRGFFFTRFLR